MRHYDFWFERLCEGVQAFENSWCFTFSQCGSNHFATLFLMVLKIPVSHEAELTEKAVFGQTCRDNRSQERFGRVTPRNSADDIKNSRFSHFKLGNAARPKNHWIDAAPGSSWGRAFY